MNTWPEALCNPAVCSAEPSEGYMKAGDVIMDAAALMKELADMELAAITGAISMELDSVMKREKRQKAGVHILQALTMQPVNGYGWFVAHPGRPHPGGDHQQLRYADPE